MHILMQGLYHNMHYRESYIDINLNNIEDNIKIIKNKNNKKFIAVIKANGYGLGDLEIAKIAIKNDAVYLAVSSLDEALSLREKNIKHPILILGYVDKTNFDLIRKYNLTIITSSIMWVRDVYQDIKGITVHIKINTGMHRLGLNSINELDETLTLFKDANIEGIFSHFTSSDEQNTDYNKKQYNLFEKFVLYKDIKYRYIHISNTDASFNLDYTVANSVRVGLGMLGYSSCLYDLKPAVSLKSKVINCHKVLKNETVSYNKTYKLDNDEYIITLPIGYADGVIRAHQNQQVYIEGQYGTIVGRICMDMLMIKVSKPYQLMTEVEFFGEHISLYDYAKRVNTIPYEILVLLSERLVKKYLYNNKLIYEITPRFKRGNDFNE